jgi:hypothetical protein
MEGCLAYSTRNDDSEVGVMTDRQFILSVDPKARVIRLYNETKPLVAKEFYISSRELYFWDAQGSTRKEAWATGAKLLREKFLGMLAS